MTSIDIYSILASKPHNEHYLKRYLKFIFQCQHSADAYVEEHHICPKASDMFPEYALLNAHTWNQVLLTTRQHIIAHIILWRAYRNISQTSAVHYMLNVQNSQTIWFNKRNVPTSLAIRYAAKAKQEYYTARKNTAVYKTLDGKVIGVLQTDDIRIQQEGLVGHKSGSKMSEESKERMRRAKDTNRKIKLWFLNIASKVKINSDEYAVLIEQGWLPYRTPDSYEFGKNIHAKKMSEKMSGKGYFSYSTGEFYGRLNYHDPLISKLGLITQPRTANQKSQAAEQAKKNAQNKEMQIRKGKTMSTRKWYHNPETNENKRLSTRPDGWKEGRSHSDISNKGREFWNDGIKNYMLSTEEIPEPHWVKGMKPRSV